MLWSCWVVKLALERNSATPNKTYSIRIEIGLESLRRKLDEAAVDGAGSRYRGNTKLAASKLSAPNVGIGELGFYALEESVLLPDPPARLRYLYRC